MSGAAAAKLALLLLIAAGACTTAVFAFWTMADDPHSNLDKGALAPEWWKQGKCESCHNPEGEAASKAPRYHTEQFRHFTHGRSEQAAERCQQCHLADACRDCHARAPASHTAGFRRPGASDLEAQRHAVLARLRPSACLACHGSFNTTCGACHTRAETDAWSERGAIELKRWPMLAPKPERP